MLQNQYQTVHMGPDILHHFQKGKIEWRSDDARSARGSEKGDRGHQWHSSIDYRKLQRKIQKLLMMKGLFVHLPRREQRSLKLSA